MPAMAEQEHIEEKREAARQKRTANREAAREINKKLIDQKKMLLTPEQAAVFLSVELQTLANWRSCGRGPKFLKAGKRLIRYKLGDLERWIAENSSDDAA